MHKDTHGSNPPKGPVTAKVTRKPDRLGHLDVKPPGEPSNQVDRADPDTWGVTQEDEARTRTPTHVNRCGHREEEHTSGDMDTSKGHITSVMTGYKYQPSKKEGISPEP